MPATAASACENTDAHILRLAGPCAGNTPHTHPRGSEISFVLYGDIEFGMVEENGGKNNLIIRNITQNETIHIPTGPALNKHHRMLAFLFNHIFDTFTCFICCIHFLESDRGRQAGKATMDKVL